MTNRYHIDKISDLLSVPIERREACVRDLLYGLALHELAFGDDAKNTPINGMQWTDDNDHSVTLHDPEGAVVLSMKITGEAPQ